MLAPARLFPWLALLVVVLALGATQARIARADSGYPAGAHGYDISYPQCPGKKLPAGSFGFAIIGVNNGKALTKNPCFADQIAWARKGSSAPAVYINSNSPPADYTNAACKPADSLCLAYEYGRESARYAVAATAPVASDIQRYWLDVETQNTWGSNVIENASVLRGMIDALKAAGKITGIYSTGYQFRYIAGNYAPGLDNWVPRPEARWETAANYCRSTPSFGGGRVVMIQLWYTFDENYACSPNLAPTAASAPTPGHFVVATGLDCVNLRTAPGVGNTILDCLPDGFALSSTGPSQKVGEYTWEPVVTAGGMRGWVAQEFLLGASSGPATAASPRLDVAPAASINLKGPFWVDDLKYGAAGGFHWDNVSNRVWTAERGWHIFQRPAGSTTTTLWVDAPGYGSASGGFYLDPIAGQVWTAERQWHLFSLPTVVAMSVEP